MLTDSIPATCAGCRKAHNGKYGLSAARNPYCYECCAKTDRATMLETGRTVLYLTRADDGYWYATNWPGTLRFQITLRHKGKHNMARVRYDVWFRGPDGKAWHGVQYGDNTQLLHCRRTKD